MARFQNVEIIQNSLLSIVGYGITLEDCTTFDVSSNRTKTTGRAAIYLNGCVDGKASGNTLLDYNGLNASENGILVGLAAADVAIFGNSFDPAFEDYAVYVTSGTANRIRIYDNILLYAHTFGTTAFRNDGTNPNAGTITAVNGNAAVTVTNTLAREGSTIIVQQQGGYYVRPVKVTQSDGAFVLTGAAVADGDETYRWEIRQ